MPVGKLKDYLNQHNVKYTSVTHPLAYAAREVSHICHISERQLAKTVMILAGKKLIMAVIPACDAVDFNCLRKSLHENDVALASEKDFIPLFPDCEVGAMPPFGNLYEVEVCVEKSLAKNDEIAFNAGTHTEVVKLAYKDFEKLVKPKVMSITH